MGHEGTEEELKIVKSFIEEKLPQIWTQQLLATTFILVFLNKYFANTGWFLISRSVNFNNEFNVRLRMALMNCKKTSDLNYPISHFRHWQLIKKGGERR